jgi:hypothetical protein
MVVCRSHPAAISSLGPGLPVPAQPMRLPPRGRPWWPGLGSDDTLPGLRQAGHLTPAEPTRVVASAAIAEVPALLWSLPALLWSLPALLWSLPALLWSLEARLDRSLHRRALTSAPGRREQNTWRPRW